MRFISLLTALACAAGCRTMAMATKSSDIRLNREWAEKAFAADVREGNLPFSFVYGGRDSAEFIANWKAKVTDKKRAGGLQRTLTLSDPETGLEVTAEVTAFADTPGVHWTLFFTNRGKEDTPVIEQVRALDVAVKTSAEKVVTLHRMHGTTSMWRFTYKDFMPYSDEVPADKPLEFGVTTGWPSQDGNPFFTLDWGDGGVVTAVGWTGHWGGSVAKSESGVRLEAGMRTIHLKLRPGESIRSPRIMQVRWSGGDQYKGYNLFRQTMLKHVLPKVKGKLVVPPFASACVESNATNEAIERGYVEAFKGTGIEVYWMDAWWMRGDPSYPNGMGNYGFPITRVPDPIRFPNGLKPIGDLAHKAGFKFLLWISPETVWPGSYLSSEHPEWVLRKRAEDGGSLNLGIPEAREYVTRYVNAVAKEYGLDVFRTDHGATYEGWQLGDTDPDRIGMTEIRAVEGLYKMWDDVLAANPNLFIDNCCGGGSRIDLETCSRSIPLWRTDGACVLLDASREDIDGNAMQNQIITMGLNRYVPISGGAAKGMTPYHLRSACNGGFVLCQDVRPKEFPRDMLIGAIREGKRLRRYLFGDYYPLTPITDSPADWAAYQYHLPASGDGMVMAFRRPQADSGLAELSLRDIDVDAAYEVTFRPDFKTSTRIRMTGKELKLLKVKTADKPGSMLVEYRKAK
jgi:alpha-galactosidase